MSNNTKSKIYEQFYEYPIPFDPAKGMDVFSDIDEAPSVDDIGSDFKKSNCYMSNIQIMRSGVEFPYTQEQLDEFVKCKNNMLYFIVNYCKIITLKDGLKLFKLFQYQKNALKIVHENRFSIFKFPRQMGKCIVGDTTVEIRINGIEMKMTIAEFYSIIEVDNIVESYTPNYEYQILTEDGYKDFDGITTRKANELVEIILEDDSIIKITPDHEIKLFEGKFIKGKDLTTESILGVESPLRIKSIQILEGDFKVADLISVKDTASFVVNDMSAILSNCIDGESIVTLLDNKTKEIFEIHISELYDYLLLGSQEVETILE